MFRFVATVVACAIFCLEADAAEIRTLHVISEIQARFAISDILSIIENTSPRPEEITFFAQLPENAFISNFSMEINGQLTLGEVREKQRARTAYEEAKRRGQSAGHVAEDPRETNSFLISVNSAPYSKVTFVLTYQEVLRRAHGAYKHVINVQPQGPVDDLQVDVLISEKKPISMVHVPQFAPRIGERTNRELIQMPADPNVQIRSHNEPSGSLSYISFNPTRNLGRQRVSGQLVVLYDVERQFSGGEIEVVNGYFVHFIAPEGMDPVPKNVIFVIDKSGSMHGRKMDQTKQAMRTILRDMEYQDRFNVLAFSNDVAPWVAQSVPATPENVDRAIQFIDQIRAGGGTNIYSAVQQGFQVLSQDRANPMRMVILLTDGQPTVGVTDQRRITSDMQSYNRNPRATLHAISFGNDADYKLLQQLTAGNGGIARKVYEAADATLQMTGFIEEIANPFLSQVQIRYIDQSVDTGSLIEESTGTLYQGGEGIVVGRTATGAGNNLEATVFGQGKSGPVRLEAFADFNSDGNTIGCIAKPDAWTDMPTPRHRDIVCPGLVPAREQPFPVEPRRPTQPPLPPSTLGGFLEHMWAYMTIKHLLDKAKYQANSRQEAQQFRQRALELSLQYNFVTELTSMVVLPPDGRRPSQLMDTKNLRTTGRTQVPQASELRGENGEPRTRRPVIPSPPTQPPKPLLPTGKCFLDVGVVVDKETSTGKLYQVLRFVSSFISEITRKPNTEIRIAVLTIDRNREATSLHQFSDSQFPASIISKINRILFSRWVGRGRNNYDTVKSALSTSDGRKKVLVYFGGPQSLGNFGREIQLMRQAGVELFGVAVGGKFHQQPDFELKTLAGNPDNVLENPNVDALENKISC